MRSMFDDDAWQWRQDSGIWQADDATLEEVLPPRAVAQESATSGGRVRIGDLGRSRKKQRPRVAA